MYDCIEVDSNFFFFFLSIRTNAVFFGRAATQPSFFSLTKMGRRKKLSHEQKISILNFMKANCSVHQIAKKIGMCKKLLQTMSRPKVN